MRLEVRKRSLICWSSPPDFIEKKLTPSVVVVVEAVVNLSALAL